MTLENSECSGNSEHSDDHFCQTTALPSLDALVVPLVLQARGDAGPLQAARRAARLVLLRLRARARLARAPAQLGRSEPTPAHAPGRAREGAEWTDDRGGYLEEPPRIAARLFRSATSRATDSRSRGGANLLVNDPVCS